MVKTNDRLKYSGIPNVIAIIEWKIYTMSRDIFITWYLSNFHIYDGLFIYPTIYLFVYIILCNNYDKYTSTMQLLYSKKWNYFFFKLKEKEKQLEEKEKQLKELKDSMEELQVD